MEILAIIPARSGSKGVLGKNIKLLNGKPLIAYSIETAVKSGLFKHIVVSTDDPDIAEIAKSYGAETPFLRPAELAADHSPTIDTVLHAIHCYAEKGVEFDAVCLLQPTVPFRDIKDLQDAITLYKSSGSDTLISMRTVPHHFHPDWVYIENQHGRVQLASGGNQPVIRRQELSNAFHRDGSIYLSKTNVISEKGSLYGETIIPFEMNRSPNINIDTMDDWEKAEKYISK